MRSLVLPLALFASNKFKFEVEEEEVPSLLPSCCFFGESVGVLNPPAFSILKSSSSRSNAFRFPSSKDLIAFSMRCHLGRFDDSFTSEEFTTLPNCSPVGQSAQHVKASLSTNSLINSESASNGSNWVPMPSNCSLLISSSVPSSFMITTVVDADADTSASNNSSHAFKTATPSLEDHAIMFARAIFAFCTATSISLSRERFKHSRASARKDFSAVKLFLLVFFLPPPL